MQLSRMIPTMFHRRLLLLMVLFVAAVAGLAAQLGVLTVARADALRAAAEARLQSIRWIPTTRGRILDRKGLVLAQDRPSFDLAVAYPVIDGSWAEERAGAAARRLHRKEWRELDASERDVLVEHYATAYRAHLDAAWSELARITGHPAAELVERRRVIINRVEALRDTVVRRRQRQGVAAALARGREITTEVEEEIDRRARADIRELETPHVVLPQIEDPVGFELNRLAAVTADIRLPDGTVIESDVPVLPGVSVLDSAAREYPLDTMTVRIDRSTFPTPIRSIEPATVIVEGVVAHVLGWTGRNATADDIQRRRDHLAADSALAARETLSLAGREFDRGQYEVGDTVGRYGVEAGREEALRGRRGIQIARLDTHEENRVPPEPGQDQRLTIDAMLQARLQALMAPELGLARVQPWHGLPTHDAEDREIPGTAEGTPLTGAAVVLDIQTSEILALASTPGISRRAMQEDPDSVFKDPYLPYFNRAVAGRYPPGSVAKALMLAASVTLGKHSLSTPIACNGHLYPNQPDMLRCWIYKRSQTEANPYTHTAMFGHPLDAREALMVSCNIYFFTLGQKLGLDGITRAYRMFGVGRTWGLGLARPDREGNPTGDEYPGEIGGTGAFALTQGDAIQMGIGQGPVSWTPLHAADAMATLARGGVRIVPSLIIDPARKALTEDLKLDPAAVQAALAGLSSAVNDARDGTGQHITLADHSREPIFNAPKVHVWGKTGTAAAPRLTHDPDGKDGPERPRLLREGDHSWFVILVGREGGPPRYSIAVMMEYAGSGGKVSGPICNQIIHALIAEGYL